MAKILIVEDDPDTANELRRCLERELYQVEVARTGSEGEFMLKSYQFDVVVLDWELPEQTGLEILSQYRRSGGSTPVIMLTGKKDIEFKEAGLDRGADDYLTKPFAGRELSARIRALLRRPKPISQNLVKCGIIEIDLNRRTVTKASELVALQPLEFSLLEFFVRHPNQALSQETLLNQVWKSESEATAIAVRTAITRLRKKLQVEGNPPLIATVHGIGYRMDVPQDAADEHG